MWGIIAALVVNCMFFSPVNAALVETPVDMNSPVVQTVLKVREARVSRDFKANWEMTDSFTKRERFHDDFNEFTAFSSEKRATYSPEESELKGMIQITPVRVWVSATNPRAPAFQGLYLVKEDGWKMAFIEVYLNKVAKDLAQLKDAVSRYYTENKKLPASLSQLVPAYSVQIPVDPFNDAKTPYGYIPSETSFVIYSFGPDSRDDYGVAIYDSKKGTISEGDIISETVLTQ